MNKENLLLMATMLTEVRDGTWSISSAPKSIKKQENKKNKFNLLDWVKIGYAQTSSDCGFTACAVGHALLDQRFKKLGLSFSNVDTNSSSLAPYFRERGGWSAVQAFFGLCADTTKFLFSDDRYPRYLVNNENQKNLLNQIIRRIHLLVDIGEDKFANKFYAYPHKTLVSPSLKTYKVRNR